MRGRPVCRSGPESRGQSAALGLCVGQLASATGVHPPTRGLRCGQPAGVSVVGPYSGDLGALNWASGERWGCLSLLHSPEAVGGGAPEAAAAVESL